MTSHYRPVMSDLVSFGTAAKITNISERRLRRWAASGKLPVMTGQHGKRVSLAAVRLLASELIDSVDGDRSLSGDCQSPDPSQPDTDRSSTEYGWCPGRTLSGSDRSELHLGLVELVQLVRDLNQQVLELSGRCGFYQAEVQQLREQVRLLSTPAGSELVEATNDPAEAEPDLKIASERVRRPWWQFWRSL